MYIFLYTSNGPADLPEHDFLGIDLRERYQHIQPGDYLYKMDKEEYYANYIAGSLDEVRYKDIKAVIINKDLGGNGWARAVRLAGHIATTPYSHCQLHKVPIVLTDRSPLDIRDSSLYETAISHPFREGAFYFFSHNELITPIHDEVRGKSISFLEKRQLDRVDVNALQVKGSKDSRHQSTNEWGAMRLAYNFGLHGEMTFNYPRHLYFKHLALSIQRKSVTKDTSLNGIFKRILLIDDHADSGWSELIMKIFGCVVDPLGPDKKKELLWEAVNYVQYDLILLDLYLEGRPDKALSLDILEIIKSKCPQVPVVIFTASEKAWNMNEVLEKGADAMYIKESPEYVSDSNYSRENFQHFKKTILDVSEKYKTLRPYWDVIDQILTHPNFKKIENSPRRIKDRLEERLKMFYGLLKKGYEQRQYDKSTFFYSDFELSFMTLWSMLNEIQTYKFEKRHSRKGTVTWKLPSEPMHYIQYQPRSGRRPATFQTDLVPLPAWYKRPLADSNLSNFQQQIALQIRYILQRMNPAAPAGFATRLTVLNRNRNSLYLTHGENSPTYFSATEEVKRKTMTSITPQGDIKDLFNLIAYIVTMDLTVHVI